MALFKCSECGKEISDKAERCPYCGCPIKEIKKAALQDKVSTLKSNKKKVYIVGSIDIAFAVFALVLFFYFKDRPPSEEELLIGKWQGQGTNLNITVELNVYESKTLDYYIHTKQDTSDVEDKKWIIKDGFLCIAEKDSDKYRQWFKILKLTEHEFEYKVKNLDPESEWGHIRVTRISD